MFLETAFDHKQNLALIKIGLSWDTISKKCASEAGILLPIFGGYSFTYFPLIDIMKARTYYPFQITTLWKICLALVNRFLCSNGRLNEPYSLENMSGFGKQIFMFEWKIKLALAIS